MHGHLPALAAGLLLVLAHLAPAAWAADDAESDPGSDWQSKFHFDDTDDVPAPEGEPAPEHAPPLVTSGQADSHVTEPADIVLKTARYLHEYRQPLRVAAQILAEEVLGDISAAEGREAQQVIEAYSRAGLYDRALYLESRLSAGWTVDESNQFWLEQARLMLSRAEPQQAERALRNFREPHDAVTRGRYQSLLQLSYINQGRFDAVVTAFESGGGSPELLMQGYYNYAVALSGQGRRPEALALLDELGEVTASTNEMLALRDHSNLVLAWQWLADNQGGSARAVFKRIGLERKSAGMALLGLGWAELAPDGRRQETRFRRKLNCVDELSVAETTEERLVSSLRPCMPVQTAPMFKYYRLFDYEAGGVAAERVKRALLPWQVLAQREPHEPAVQEALLAIGYAWARLKHYAEAEAAYRAAIQRYQEELGRLDKLASALNGPDSDPRLVLQSKVATNEFSEVHGSRDFAAASTGLDDLLAVGFELADINRRLRRSEVGGAGLDARSRQLQAQHAKLLADSKALQAELNARIRAQYLADVDSRRRRLRKYLANASLALAKLYDLRSK